MEYVDLLKKVKEFFGKNDLIEISYRINGINIFDIAVSETLTGGIIANIQYCNTDNSLSAFISGDGAYEETPEKFFEKITELLGDKYNKFLNSLTKLDNYEREEGEGTEKFL